MMLSKVLLSKYGTLANIVRQFQQDQAPVQDVPYPVEQRLCAAARAVSRLLHREALEGPAISSPDILAGCLRNEMAGLARETFRVLFLDAGNRLLADETMWEGTIDRVQIHPREVIRRAIETGATALIVAHNHPGGDPAPSRHDVAMTNKLVAACTAVELLVHDHIIVSRSGWFSMAEHGLIARTIATEHGSVESLAVVARKRIKERQLRGHILGMRDLFGEPAWDILLDLFVANADGSRVSVSSACAATTAPHTTALRYLRALEENGMITRAPHESDARIIYVTLSEAALGSMKSILSHP
jgi:DNA repair protein RadC